MRCPEKDPVWDRQCEREDAGHVSSTDVAERLHVDTKPGDILTWGTIADLREHERKRDA